MFNRVQTIKSLAVRIDSSSLTYSLDNTVKEKVTQASMLATNTSSQNLLELLPFPSNIKVSTFVKLVQEE